MTESQTGPPAPSTDLVAGGFSTLIGAGGLWPARDWPLGSPTDPGSGAFPVVVCLGLVGLGIWLAVRSLISRRGTRLSIGGLRPAAVITLSVTLFALLLDRAGLILSILLLVLIADRAGARPRAPTMLVLGAVLAGACALLFVRGLGLPMRVWPRATSFSISPWVSRSRSLPKIFSSASEGSRSAP